MRRIGSPQKYKKVIKKYMIEPSTILRRPLRWNATTWEYTNKASHQSIRFISYPSNRHLINVPLLAIHAILFYTGSSIKLNKLDTNAFKSSGIRCPKRGIEMNQVPESF